MQGSGASERLGSMEKRLFPLFVLGALLIPAAGAQAATKPVFAGHATEGTAEGRAGVRDRQRLLSEERRPSTRAIACPSTVPSGSTTSSCRRRATPPADLFAAEPPPVSGIKDAAGVGLLVQRQGRASASTRAAAAPIGRQDLQRQAAVGSGLPPARARRSRSRSSSPRRAVTRSLLGPPRHEGEDRRQGQEGQDPDQEAGPQAHQQAEEGRRQAGQEARRQPGPERA